MDPAHYRSSQFPSDSSEANALFRAVRHLLREGDITGHAAAGPDTLTDAIRAQEAIVVPVINIKAASAPTDDACILVLVEPYEVPHWVLGPISSTLDARAPRRPRGDA